jgi:60 kDa SS-A/Ro ribonucleoprotein
MKNYSTNLTKTPQTQPIFGRTDMVQNNTGGYVFKITDEQILERFLLIGSEGGTYYVDEQKLTLENSKKIVEMIKKNGKAVVEKVVDYAINRRAPKTDAGIFVLALATTFGDQETKQLAYSKIVDVCKNSTQLFTFVANIQNLRGWSRGLRKAVAKFYDNKKADSLAYQLVKYRNRAGFTHKDVLRLCHPTAKDEQINQLFKYAVGKCTEAESGHSLIENFGKAQQANEKELLKLIKESALTWEMIPTEKLNNEKVLNALLPHMPLVALMRNLNRFSYNGMTTSFNDTVKKICSILTNAEMIEETKIHPINVVNSLATYSSGHGLKGSKTWEANNNIVDALVDCYDLSLKETVKTDKNILIGVDISGSMNSPVGGMSLSAAQIAGVLALTMLKTEKNAEVVCFDTSLHKPYFGKRSDLLTVINNAPCGGGTDCGQPLKHACDTLNKYDAIIILTDNETWAGREHNFDLLKSYRKNVNKNVKVIEVAMVSNPISTFPSDDPNLLRVVGFDSSVVDIINKYLNN